MTEEERKQQEAEAEEYLLSLSQDEPMEIMQSWWIIPIKSDMDWVLNENYAIIEGCNKILKNRILSDDTSLTLKDLISAKDTAFKQNQLIMWRATENININIKELEDKSPEELLDMLNSLNG